MFNNYEKVKRIMKDSFSEIMSEMDKQQLSYEEIKDLMVKALYLVSKENRKPKSDKLGEQVTVNEVQTITTQQALYGPPVMDDEIITEVVYFNEPQVLYGPPQDVDVETVIINPTLEQGDDFIPGTNIRRPREKKINESESEYLEFLNNYYGRFFSDENKGKTRR